MSISSSRRPNGIVAATCGRTIRTLFSPQSARLPVRAGPDAGDGSYRRMARQEPRSRRSFEIGVAMVGWRRTVLNMLKSTPHQRPLTTARLMNDQTAFNGADALVRMLQFNGVKHIFGLCGDT